MTRRAKSIVGLVCLATVMIAASAWANPVSSVLLRANQTASTHVQITFGYSSSVSGAPTDFKRDDVALSAQWTAGTYKGNTGSGVVNLNSYQFCDCNVPVGKHTYSITTTDTYSPKLSVDITVQSAPTVYMDAGVARDMMSWEIPDPPAQGIDCATLCATPKEAGVVVKADAAPVNADSNSSVAKQDASSTSKPPSNDGGGGCSVAQQAAGGAPLLLLALGLLLVLARRKR